MRFNSKVNSWHIEIHGRSNIILINPLNYPRLHIVVMREVLDCLSCFDFVYIYMYIYRIRECMWFDWPETCCSWSRSSSNYIPLTVSSPLASMRVVYALHEPQTSSYRNSQINFSPFIFFISIQLFSLLHLMIHLSKHLFFFFNINFVYIIKKKKKWWISGAINSSKTFLILQLSRLYFGVSLCARPSTKSHHNRMICAVVRPRA